MSYDYAKVLADFNYLKLIFLLNIQLSVLENVL